MNHHHGAIFLGSRVEVVHRVAVDDDKGVGIGETVGANRCKGECIGLKATLYVDIARNYSEPGPLFLH